MSKWGCSTKQVSLKIKGKKMRTMTIAAVALVAALSAWATGFDELTLRTNEWFAVSMADVAVGTPISDATGVTSGAGSWTALSSGTATNAVENETRFIALSTLDEQLTFTPAPFAVTSGYETVVAQIKADAGEELPVVDAKAQAAFTVILTNDTLQAFGWTYTGWTNVSYTASDTLYLHRDDLTNAWFTLYMDFANGESSTRYVRYSVRPNNGSLAVLSDSTGASWFPTTYSPTINTISFGGIGKVQNFSGDELAEHISFSNVEITYLASYASATTVVATVSGTVAAGTTFSINFGESDYNGTYDSETRKVTFYNVGSGLNVGDTKTYTISTVGTYTDSASVSQPTLVGDLSDDWILENSSHRSTSGAWTNSANEGVTLEYSPAAAINNYLFTPTNAVADAVVTVESQVCFGDVADPETEPPADSYAAVRLAEITSEKTFQVWAKETENGAAGWISVFNGNDVDPTSTTTVLSKFDFAKGTCSFYEGGTALTNASGESCFLLANGVHKMKAIKFNGVGTLTQLRGSYVAAGYYEEVGAGTNVTVSSIWVANNLSDKTVAEARELMSPTNRTDAALTQHGGTEFNYFECYALGINPDDENEAPIITATPDGTGKFSMKLEGINVPEGVTLTVTLQGSVSPSSDFTDLAKAKATAVGKSDGTTTASGAIEFDPAHDMEGNVKYLKMDVSIGATP